jgi:hypothetical protein
MCSRICSGMNLSWKNAKLMENSALLSWTFDLRVDFVQGSEESFRCQKRLKRRRIIVEKERLP